MRFIAVIGYSYRSFNEWTRDNPQKPGHKYVFINSEDKVRGYVFDRVEYLHDAYLLQNCPELKELVNRRIK